MQMPSTFKVQMPWSRVIKWLWHSKFQDLHPG